MVRCRQPRLVTAHRMTGGRLLGPFSSHPNGTLPSEMGMPPRRVSRTVRGGQKESVHDDWPSPPAPPPLIFKAVLRGRGCEGSSASDPGPILSQTVHWLEELVIGDERRQSRGVAVGCLGAGRWRPRVRTRQHRPERMANKQCIYICHCINDDLLKADQVEKMASCLGSTSINIALFILPSDGRKSAT